VKAPGFTAITVLTLALGIGANSALFSVVNSVLLKPLPFPHPDQLVALAESKSNFESGSISYPNFRDWQKENHTFSSLAIYRGNSFNLAGAGEAENVSAELLSSDFFTVLGVKPLLGRNFAEREDEIGAAPIVMISEGLWKRKFGGTREIIGRGITLDGKIYTVVGVVPASFDFALGSFQVSEIYAPIGQWNNPLLVQRNAGLGIHGVGRLKPGMSIEQARADMQRVTSNLAIAYPEADRGIGANLKPLRKAVVGSVQPLLLVLLGAVGFVLLIACVNVANLLLARSTTRTREFAVRTALGASQGRLVKQLLTESVLIGLAGGGIGLLIAGLGTRTSLAALPQALPRAGEVQLDGRVLLFTFVISVAAGILFGLTPALKTSHSNLHVTLKEGGRGTSGGHHRVQATFVVLEMGLALVLLIGAGLMLRTLAYLWGTNPGFDPRNVLSFSLAMPPSMSKATPDAIREMIRAIDTRINSTPGVVATSQFWGALPIANDDERLFWLEGEPKPASSNEMKWAIDYIVEPSYLKVMDIPLRRGRFFSETDNEHAPLVVAVDDAFARKFFPGQDPIGKRLHLEVGADSNSEMVEIVGVVGHVKQWGLDQDEAQPLREQIYIPFMQLPDEAISLIPSGAGILARTRTSPGALFDSIRQSLRQMNGEQVAYGPQTMNEVIALSLSDQRFTMILLGTFATLALLLASVGIYGVISYVVGQRTHEIGVRMALGADARDILKLVLQNGGKLALTGVAAGLIASVGLTKLMAGMLYGVKPTDPLTFLGVAFLLSMVALVACYIPGRRATQVDPIVALRYE